MQDEILRGVWAFGGKKQASETGAQEWFRQYRALPFLLKNGNLPGVILMQKGISDEIAIDGSIDHNLVYSYFW